MSQTEEPDLPSSDLVACEEVLGYTFRDRSLLDRALTHASISSTRLTSNERLEFLGDAVLGAVVCEMLYERFPQSPEGELTRMKSIIVSRNMCARLSRQMGLEEFMRLGKGLSRGGEIPQSILAGVFEALIAAIRLDGGAAAAREFVTRMVEPQISTVCDTEQSCNFKSLLQQSAQRVFGETPGYRLLDEKGPDHSKCFNVSAVIGNRTFDAAWGPSKKEAEQAAARKALDELALEDIDAP